MGTNLSQTDYLPSLRAGILMGPYRTANLLTELLGDLLQDHEDVTVRSWSNVARLSSYFHLVQNNELRARRVDAGGEI